MSFQAVDSVLTRLQVCHREIEGVRTSFKAPPEKALAETALPAMYSICDGMAGTPVPMTNSGVGQVSLPWKFRSVIMVATIQGGIENGYEGSPGYNKCLPFLDLLADYYLVHPRLNSDGLYEEPKTELVLTSNISFLVGKIAQIPGPGDADFWGISTDLYINVRALATSTN